ncbi:UDP-N-acetylmuramoyl-L-alanyl-D-glutamate--2,6-diaminopimelate ligase [Virgibacillus halodenitrificans]|uniref:UDP-N-acetylmuramoyl-L-alanyl-D-glutamate--2, 6-diaminopimelate ligase n=1 Tax=Virgibacillus halodenitrificans TaxID=1482 RepID=UPI00045CC48B|nr:UDP-N-acetylmuramoyl-L-alanyl-D-glutamate--2,6-diaminopimelate ligase [Virgibacillus halodenitrificans]CDQ36853.1 UDP-N-acetylmuramoyl-L-alanyl-D-glutamate--LD-lysine ligase [Virgibacillus halodenitrificans]
MDFNTIVKELAKEMKTFTETKYRDIQIKGIAYDSRKVREGYLFIAIKGVQADGHRFIDEAIRQGATVIIGENDISLADIPYIKVENARRALAILSDRFYHSPSMNKFIIGITGTNGKTTTSYLLKHVLEQADVSCTMIGSIQNSVNGKIYPSMNTTPGPLELNQLLYESRDEVVIMEVSSHALKQCRVDGILFDVALFTNLSHDHLDYHASMEEYFNVKKLLFDKLKKEGKAVVNSDDSYGEQLLEILFEKGVASFTVGKTKRSDIRFASLNESQQRMKLHDGGNFFEVDTKLPGTHNFYNMAMAYITAKIVGVAPETIAAALASFTGLPGRFQQIKSGGVTCVIDYAHTPDAVFHCLQAVRQAGAGRLNHIFGWRGGRDETKRSEMLSISAEISDSYTLTLDDLNGVAQEKMISDLNKLQSEYGMSNGTIIPDRTIAIMKAIEHAAPGDWIVITGKGNEEYQQNFYLDSKSDEETVTYCFNNLVIEGEEE